MTTKVTGQRWSRWNRAYQKVQATLDYTKPPLDQGLWDLEEGPDTVVDLIDGPIGTSYHADLNLTVRINAKPAEHVGSIHEGQTLRVTSKEGKGRIEAHYTKYSNPEKEI